MAKEPTLSPIERWKRSPEGASGKPPPANLKPPPPPPPPPPKE